MDEADKENSSMLSLEGSATTDFLALLFAPLLEPLIFWGASAEGASSETQGQLVGS